MSADPRVKAGISSCGFFELLNFFNDKEPVKRWASSALPGLAKVGKSADYLAALAPRPILLTRGKGEWLGHPDGERRSAKHVQETVELELYSRKHYEALNAGDNLKVIYFDGGHFFTLLVKKIAYHWLDKYLNFTKWQREESLIQRLDDLCTQTKQQSEESALQCVLPVEKQDHIRHLIFIGQSAKAAALIEESQGQIRDFSGTKFKNKKVKFTFYAPAAKEVFVAGSFNGWNPTKDKLTKQSNGRWETSMSLPVGVYCYKFVADGEWFIDPQNTETYYNAEGGENSVLVVSR
ncbi:MAG: hypothetical protein HY958_14235 [Bacteroidia bacterium]|nr:hypothetical protein [Bacteroidia bacterium]